ncbi:MAG: hypothetical protein FWG85_04980 [Bacteroidetes bacterium]|nr:hypothetical protein [Bacteroidota bacterium]
MKRLIISILFLISVPNLFSFGGGNGTESDPYEIANYDDMLELRDSVAYGIRNPPYNWSYQKYFKVTNDITTPVDFSIGATSFAQDGETINSSGTFEGNFDGQNNIITLNLAGGGIFRGTSRNIIQNVILVGELIYTVSNTGSLVGLAFFNTTIKNCIVYCNITRASNLTDFASVGGIVGEARHNIIVENCIFAGKITLAGADNVGGIVSILSNSNIVRNCQNIGNIIFTGQNTAMKVYGGIVGLAGGLTENCIWSGYIKFGEETRDGFGCGGIVGYVPMNYQATTIISNCIVTGVIEGIGNVGAIVGTQMVPTLTITNCHYDKQFCIHKGVNGADVPGVSGHITRNMVGRKLASLLGDIDWTYVEGATLIQSLYPQLKVFSESPDKRKSDASKAGASPIFLYDGIKDKE